MQLNRTLYVTSHRAKVSVSKKNLLVKHPDGDKQRVPFNAVEAVVLLGSAQITSQAMAKCARSGVPVTSVSKSGRVKFSVRGGTAGNVQLRLAQFAAHQDESRRIDASRNIVAAKLQNSRRVLLRWSRDADPRVANAVRTRAEHIGDRLERVRTAENRSTLRGLEGDAARAYFRGLRMVLAQSDVRFEGRSRRPPRDVPNAMISFVYGMLTTELVGAIESVGLDPQIGLFHDHRPGRPALALDLLEELRAPFADRLIVGAMRRRMLGPEDCTRLPGGAVRLTDDGRKRLLKLYDEAKDAELFHTVLDREVPRWSLPHVQATLLARNLRGDIPAYPPFALAA